ncbi:MAG: hypothetical protein AAF709_18835 [Pseudomonadota bacterium]
MHQPDNWGWKARIGMFIVSTEAVPEAEWWAMMPSGVSVHAARIKATTPWAKWEGEGSIAQLEDDLKRGAEHFSEMRLSAVVIGHSSSSLLGGKGWDEAVIARLSEIVAPETHVTTNGLDCVAALRASEVKRPFLVFPAWFGPNVHDKGTQYFADQGLSPCGHMQFDPGRGWRDLPPNRLYPEGMGFEQDVEALYRQVRAACPDEADGVLIIGTGFRCVGILQSLERDLGKPVVSANQASLWNCLRLSGVRAAVSGYGRLLEI